MSVINRMLTDLERRGAGPTVDIPPLPAPAPPTRRRRAWPLQALLAVALVAVASALWLQRGPYIADQVRLLATAPAVGETPTVAPGTTADTAADAPAGGEPNAASAEHGEAVAAFDPRHSPLTGMRFEAVAGERVALVLEFGGEPPPVFLPHLEDGRVVVRLLAAAPAVAVPAPPREPDLFRSVALRSVGAGSEIHIEVADGVAVAIDRDGGTELRLAASVAASTPVADNVTGERAHASDTDEPATTERTIEPVAGLAVDVPSSAAAVERSNAAASAGGDVSAGPDGPSAVAPAAVAVSNAGGGDIRREASPDDAELRARRRYADARDALAAGDIGSARRRLEQAIELDPGLHSAREVLVALARRAGDDDRARDLLRVGIEHAPARATFAKPYARLLADTDELERARDVLDAARLNAEGDLDFHALAANIHRRLGEHRAAIAEYTAALEIDDSPAMLWLGLGISLAEAGHAEQARAAFAEARDSGQLGDRLQRWTEQRIAELAAGED